MTRKFLTLVREGSIVTCTMSNPPRHTLVAAEVSELAALVAELEADPRVGVVVFTGGGAGVFIAHYEVGELAASAEAVQRDGPRAPSGELHAMHRLILSLERSRLITIAAINGNAAGGGFEFALGCDFRLACEGEFRLGLPETSVGIIPGAGGTARYARLLGTARSLDLILHAKVLAPEEALALGLVHRVFPEAAFNESVQAFARDLAGRAPIALAAAKRAIRAGAELPLPSALALEQEEFDRCMASTDAAVAMRSFLQGKPWTWQGK